MPTDALVPYGKIIFFLLFTLDIIDFCSIKLWRYDDIIHNWELISQKIVIWKIDTLNIN